MYVDDNRHHDKLVLSKVAAAQVGIFIKISYRLRVE